MKEATSLPFLQPALEYAQRGWSIIPIRHLDDSGKQPTVKWKPYQSVRPTADQLREWFRDDSLDGLAVICGRVSGGLYCRDFDAEAGYHAWAAAQPEWAARLPTAKSMRGFHVYGVWHDVSPRELTQGELRSDGQYVLLPPSRHPSGAVYKWQVPPPVGELPRVAPEACGFVSDAPAVYREADSRPLSLGGSVTRSLGHSDSPKLSLSVMDARVQLAIQATLPKFPGERNHQLFQFVRQLMAIPELANLEPRLLEPLVRAWYERAKPFIRTRSFTACMGDFRRGWKKVLFPVGEDVLGRCRQRALDEPLPFCAERYDDEPARLLVAICAQLQRLHGDQPFFISCRSAGKLIDVSHPEANAILALLVDDGVLKLINAGTSRLAARYRYLGEPVHGESEPDAGGRA